MDKTWFYAKHGTTDRKGPVLEGELKSLVASGQLDATDLVWSEGMESWVHLSTLPHLHGHAAAFPAPAQSQHPASARAVQPPGGLQGWMAFVGVMNIVGGILMLLTCFGIPLGILMIAAGAAALGAGGALDQIAHIDASQETFFRKLKTFMVINGVMFILSLVLTVVSVLFYVGLATAGMSHLMPNP